MDLLEPAAQREEGIPRKRETDFELERPRTVTSLPSAWVKELDSTQTQYFPVEHLSIRAS